MDDVGGGGSSLDVARMRGVREEQGSYSGTVTKLLSTAGFWAKALVMSGTQVQEEVEALGGKFLGLGYDPTTDTIEVKVAPHIRMSKKRTRQRRAQTEIIDGEWLEDLGQGNKVLTRRRVLVFVMSQYDPLGFLANFLLSGKLLLRQLYGTQANLGWDDPLSDRDQKVWRRYIQEAVEMPAMRVPRAILQENRSQFWIVAFWDRSLDAHASTIYSRVQLRDQWGCDKGVDSRLMYAKTKVAPAEGTTIAKMELQGMVQVTRSVLRLVEALDEHVDRVIIAGDSMCALMAVRRPGVTYRVYFQN